MCRLHHRFERHRWDVYQESFGCGAVLAIGNCEFEGSPRRRGLHGAPHQTKRKANGARPGNVRAHLYDPRPYRSIRQNHVGQLVRQIDSRWHSIPTVFSPLVTSHRFHLVVVHLFGEADARYQRRRACDFGDVDPSVCTEAT